MIRADPFQSWTVRRAEPESDGGGSTPSDPDSDPSDPRTAPPSPTLQSAALPSLQDSLSSRPNVPKHEASTNPFCFATPLPLVDVRACVLATFTMRCLPPALSSPGYVVLGQLSSCVLTCVWFPRCGLDSGLCFHLCDV